MKHAFVFVTATMLGIGAAAAGTDDNKFDYGKPPGFKQGEKTGWGDEKTPPGWDRGEKQGWNDEERPPGLQNKKDSGDKDHND
jgi:hypothetical protein